MKRICASSWAITKIHDNVYGEGNRKKFVGAEEYLYTFLYGVLYFNEWSAIRRPVDELQSLRTADRLDQTAQTETTREPRSEQIKKVVRRILQQMNTCHGLEQQQDMFQVIELHLTSPSGASLAYIINISNI